MQADKLTRSITQAEALLRRFVIRENKGVKADSPDLLTTPFRGKPSIFTPVKKENGGWTPPKYSARRQKLLQRAVEILGVDPSILPPSPVKKRASAEDLPAGRRHIVASPHIPATQVLTALALEKKGPYAGRKGAAFKGHAWERFREEKLAERAQLLEKAPQRKAEFRKAQAEIRQKSKPALPF
ncbi:hypothetical protein NBRC10512_004987 [Rhodotorula toruloides]|uniref:RHTO0S01e14356g1_1 n=2 Tax=Rhodotorula toruloides TaxID=5286 RepID=A0A061AMZ7_RHOTO|nr:uncharacterized protein RHTO_04624 [Rhodotorula toruloides NP11]EMS24445.1 hypothetical protein RHTO_04624 [Rhodotorula toruloides NP11]CDR36106.1 RHTO0S01e14356g1_1 [Rhodotorula toruloides]